MQELSWKWIIDLAADSCDMNVDDIIERCMADGGVPYIPSDHLARNRRTAIYNEILKQFEFLSRQFDLGITPSHSVPSSIHFEIGDLKHRRRFGIGSAIQSAQSHEELWKSEGLNQVVISTGVEPTHTIVNGPFGCKDEYRNLEAVSPDLL